MCQAKQLHVDNNVYNREMFQLVAHIGHFQLTQFPSMGFWNVWALKDGPG